MNKILCSKCDGSGKLQHYSHISNGNCFQCEGKGYKFLSDKQLKEYQEEIKTIEKRQTEALEAELKYEKELEEIRMKQEQKKQTNIKNYQEKLSYIGNVGDQINLQLKLINRNSTKFGESYLLQDDNKNNIIFFSKNIHTVLGGNFHIEGIIKEHKDHNGYKQSVLKNVKVLNEIDLNELTDEQIDQLIL